MQVPPAGQNPHSLFPEEKENAPFDGVREKGLGGGIPDFVRNAHSAFTGVWPGGTRWFLPLTRTNVRVPPGCTAVLFRCRTLAVAEASGNVSWQSSVATGLRQQKRSREHPGAPQRQATPNCQCAAAKKEQKSIRNFPQLPKLPYAVEWAKPASFYRAKAPVTGVASVPGEARNAAAQPFSLDTIKRRFLFFLGKRERGV